MKKRVLLLMVVLAFMSIAFPCFAEECWVYVRLEDRPGVSAIDDSGRSKRGDVVAVLPINNQYIPSEEEKKEYLIFKADLNELQKASMLVGQEEVSYRKNKLNLDTLNIDKTGLVDEKIGAELIKVEAKATRDFSRYKINRIRYVYLIRPYKLIENFLIPNAMAEVVSTINKTGETYNTLTIWEDAKDGDLVTGTRQETAHVYDDDGDLTDSFTITGSTTDASYYMKITVPSAERHDGTPGTGAKLIGHINIYENYTEIHWLEIDGGTNCIEISAGDNQMDFSYLLMHDSTGDCFYTHGTATALDINLWNSIIYSCGDEGVQSNDTQQTLYVENCTIVGSTDDNLLAWNGDIYATNVISHGAGGDDFDESGTVGNVTCNYCFSEDGTADDYDGANNSVLQSFSFIASGSDDYHLDTGSDGIDEGDGDSNNISFSDDIDEDSRPGVSGDWDVGADETAGAVSRRRLMIVS